jgi:hypothetical protein
LEVGTQPGTDFAFVILSEIIYPKTQKPTMHYYKPFSILLFTCTNFVFANVPGSPRAGVLKRDTQLSCGTELFNQFDALCVAEDGTKVCATRLDTCCQLPDGKTPYTCSGLGDSHCCGTDKPACGSDPTCKNSRGDVDVQDAASAVFPSEIQVTAAPSATTGEPEQVPLATLTAEDNPNATGGAGALGAKIKEEGVIAALVAAMVLF